MKSYRANTVGLRILEVASVHDLCSLLLHLMSCGWSRKPSGVWDSARRCSWSWSVCRPRLVKLNVFTYHGSLANAEGGSWKEMAERVEQRQFPRVLIVSSPSKRASGGSESLLSVWRLDFQPCKIQETSTKEQEARSIVELLQIDEIPRLPGLKLICQGSNYVRDICQSWSKTMLASKLLVPTWNSV